VRSIEADDGGAIRCLNVRDSVTGAEQCVPVQGVFVFIGRVPNTACFKGYAPLDQWGFLASRPGQVETEVPGFFAAGDCRSGAKAQISTACGEGTMASFMVREYLDQRAKTGK
jgi:thioredoxin reductase (NADPH)